MAFLPQKPHQAQIFPVAEARKSFSVQGSCHTALGNHSKQMDRAIGLIPATLELKYFSSSY